MGEIYNFETSYGEAKKIEEKNKIPIETMTKRIDYCAKQEGLKDGLESSEEEIQNLLDKVEFKVEDRNLPVILQLHEYLNQKYSDYIWRGTKPKSEKDREI